MSGEPSLAAASRRLRDPALRGLAPGTAAWFEAQRRMIAGKPLVRRCYDLWYRRLLEDADSVPGAGGLIVELGSGLSYIKRLRPEVVTTDVVAGAADLVADGRALPFGDGTVRALLLTHVFHHIPDVGRFLTEARRVLAPGGVIGMVEETHTPFARFFFGRIHPEPYDDRAARWEFPAGDPLGAANQALSWIVFFRDAARFREGWPDLALERREYLPWLGYLLSGGVNLRSLVPRPLAPAFGALDALLRPCDRLCAIHWHLRLRKVAAVPRR
ncbi:MAG TPA: class I SAM-dependent methyltransferase [bacterium]